jgi:hypothetical protein
MMPGVSSSQENLGMKNKTSSYRFELVVICMFVLLGIFFPLGIVEADGDAQETPQPTPVRREMSITNATQPTMSVTASETYDTLVYWFYNSSTGLEANYSSTQNTSTANSQQIWLDVTYKGIYSPNWYYLDDLWDSKWGGSTLRVFGEKGVSYGSYDLHGHGTHLFDYGPNNFVWKYSDDYESYP